MADHVVPGALAPLLGWSAPTLRRALFDADVNERMATDKRQPIDRRTDDQRERDRALLTAERTPGGYTRWSRANAARVLKAYGKPVPAEWASPAGPEASR